MKNRMRAKSSSRKRQLTLLAEIALLFMIAIAIGATIAALSDSIDDGLVEERISGDFRSENEQGEYAGFILPDSDSRYYSKEELDELPTWDLYLAHNEIYACLLYTSSPTRCGARRSRFAAARAYQPRSWCRCSPRRTWPRRAAASTSWWERTAASSTR